MENKKSFTCLKCNHTKFKKNEIRTTSGFLGALLNWHSEKYIAIVCEKCSFTEFYYEDYASRPSKVDIFSSSSHRNPGTEY